MPDIHLLSVFLWILKGIFLDCLILVYGSSHIKLCFHFLFLLHHSIPTYMIYFLQLCHLLLREMVFHQRGVLSAAQVSFSSHYRNTANICHMLWLSMKPLFVCLSLHHLPCKQLPVCIKEASLQISLPLLTLKV